MLTISQFMLTATGDVNDEVAMEACDYWLVFTSLDDTLCTEDMFEVIRSFLPQLLPILLKSMIYSEEKKIELLEQNECDECKTNDKSQDVAPVTIKTKAKGGARGEDPDDEDNDDDNYNEDQEWTLRTCAAASLDSLALTFGPDSILPYLFPVLEQYLSSSDPWTREAAILALGAIEEGCGAEMNQYMNQLHSFLMKHVIEEGVLPQLACISCWTLGRYASWAVEQTVCGAQPDLIETLTRAILGRILDNNKKVQVAAVSALGVLVENSGDMIIPFLDVIYRALVNALEKHYTRSLLVTLETFGSIADTIGEASGQGHLPNIYIPPLLRMWFLKIKDNPVDRTLLPLLESLSFITLNIGMKFQPWALETFEGALSTINACMLILSVNDYSDEDADTIVCSTDILDGLVEGLGMNFERLVQSSHKFGDHFLEILRVLINHDVESVRTSAFALMGDIAKHSPVILQDGMGDLIIDTIACIDPTYPSCCNNAVWAIGEVIVKCRKNPSVLQPFATDIVQKLIVLLRGYDYGDSEHEYSMSGLTENASSTMGRIAQCDPAFVASDLDRFLSGWIDGCAKISDLGERCDAFIGLLLAIQRNPKVMHTSAPDISDIVSGILFAVVSWHIPENFLTSEILHGPYSFTSFPSNCGDLHQKLKGFIHEIKNSLGTELWSTISGSFPRNVQKLLQEQYDLF